MFFFVRCELQDAWFRKVRLEVPRLTWRSSTSSFAWSRPSTRLSRRAMCWKVFRIQFAHISRICSGRWWIPFDDYKRIWCALERFGGVSMAFSNALAYRFSFSVSIAMQRPITIANVRNTEEKTEGMFSFAFICWKRSISMCSLFFFH